MLGPFFHHTAMSIPDVDSFSASAAKPERFMRLVQSHYFTAPKHPVTPVTRADLCLVHDKDYVDAVFSGIEPNGFGNHDPRVPEAALWTVGSLTSALLFANKTHLPVCSPTSGFHHAGYAHGGGYCTFNGLMVAAAKYLQQHPYHVVGILDLDMHYGDGTADILKRKAIMNYRIVHHSAGEFFYDGGHRLEFFAWLNGAINDLNQHGCNVVLYQAGADMHINDPLGGLLDDGDMAKRDREVFRGIHAGIAWNLAGGYRGSDSIYTDKTLASHLATVGEANASDAIRKSRIRVAA